MNMIDTIKKVWRRSHFFVYNEMLGKNTIKNKKGLNGG